MEPFPPGFPFGTPLLAQARFGKVEMLFWPNGYPGSSCRQDDLPAILRFRPDLRARKKSG
jgi:hypothetical protein